MAQVGASAAVRGGEADSVSVAAASAPAQGGSQAMAEPTARTGVSMQGGGPGLSLGRPSGHCPVAMAPSCH